MKIPPYICITIERGNDLDTTFNCFFTNFRKKLGKLKTFIYICIK